MSIRLGLIFPGAALIATTVYDLQTVPAAHLLVMAYQQIWPFNVHPGSNDDSLYVARTKLAWPLHRLSAGSVQHHPRGQCLPLRGGTLSGELRTSPLLVLHVTVGYLWLHTRSWHSIAGKHDKANQSCTLRFYPSVKTYARAKPSNEGFPVMKHPLVAVVVLRLGCALHMTKAPLRYPEIPETAIGSLSR